MSGLGGQPKAALVLSFYLFCLRLKPASAGFKPQPAQSIFSQKIDSHYFVLRTGSFRTEVLQELDLTPVNFAYNLNKIVETCEE